MSRQIVCRNCFWNPGLREWVTDHPLEDPEDDEVCSFCTKEERSDHIADFDEICEYIGEKIGEEYTDPAEELPVDEGEYVFEPMDQEEVLQDAGLEINSDNTDLYSEIASQLPLEWYCRRDFFGSSKSEILKYSWDDFVKITRTGSVLDFMYGLRQEYSESMTPMELLEWLVESIYELGLITEIETGTNLYRVRYQPKGEEFLTADELGPPPSYAAKKPNRFNPAGTSMMYLAEDRVTALRETIDGFGKYAIGNFRTRSPIFVLDLANLPNEVCFFADDPMRTREPINFLRHFGEDISKQDTTGSAPEKFYIPTQIVTQHMRRYLQYGDIPVHGIRYKSAVARGGINIALFDSRIRLYEQGEKIRKRQGIVLDPQPVQFGILKLKSVEVHSEKK